MAYTGVIDIVPFSFLLRNLPIHGEMSISQETSIEERKKISQKIPHYQMEGSNPRLPASCHERWSCSTLLPRSDTSVQVHVPSSPHEHRIGSTGGQDQATEPVSMEAWTGYNTR